MFKRSIISNSPLFEGFNFLDNSITLLSKKYQPVTAKLDLVFLGFSKRFTTFLLLFKVATP